MVQTEVSPIWLGSPLLLVCLALAGGATYILFCTHFLLNSFLLLAEPVYIIPAESSIFSFNMTEQNPGSGDWWLYGEDAGHYYAYIGSAEVEYHAFPREKVNLCPGFDSRNSSTWCDAFRKSTQPGPQAKPRG